jgi:hypothetical protein
MLVTLMLSLSNKIKLCNKEESLEGFISIALKLPYFHFLVLTTVYR